MHRAFGMVHHILTNLDHILVDGMPTSGALFDLAIWCTTWYVFILSSCIFDVNLERFQRKSRKTDKMTGRPCDYCYFYIPKVENHKEARWWNQVFTQIELFFRFINYISSYSLILKFYRIPLGHLKAIVLIENFLASFEMDEILYEMRDHCLGLNAGKWDYIFSFIKKLRYVYNLLIKVFLHGKYIFMCLIVAYLFNSHRSHPQFVLSERKHLGMDLTFLNTYERLLIATCKKVCPNYISV